MADEYGYIKLYRQLKEKAFYKDSEKVHLWIHLLLKATHKGREEMLGGKPFKCEPGQFTIGRKQLAEETGIDESKVERILTYFEKIEQQIEQQKTTKNRLITILRWNNYQASEQQIEQQVNNNCTTSEQQVNTLQECKNVKNVKNDNKKDMPKFIKIPDCDFVKITQIEFDKLKEQFGETKTKDKLIKLNLYVGSTGKKYKSHYLTILNWDRKEKEANFGYKEPEKELTDAEKRERFARECRENW